jgi:hypothetical protein
MFVSIFKFAEITLFHPLPRRKWAVQRSRGQRCGLQDVQEARSR